MIVDKLIWLLKENVIIFDITALLFVVFTIATVVTFFLFSRIRNLTAKQKCCCLPILFSILLTSIAFSITAKGVENTNWLLVPLIICALQLNGIAIIFLTKKRQVKVKREHKELIDLLDDQINIEKRTESVRQPVKEDVVLDEYYQGILPEKFVKLKDNVSAPKPKAKKTSVKQIKEPVIKDKVNNLAPDIDFSHVKNILKRLNYYTLNESEKSCVDRLNADVIKAENGKVDNALKSDINDGLGFLLKIMSKYGV